MQTIGHVTKCIANHWSRDKMHCKPLVTWQNALQTRGDHESGFANQASGQPPGRVALVLRALALVVLNAPWFTGKISLPFINHTSQSQLSYLRSALYCTGFAAPQSHALLKYRHLEKFNWLNESGNNSVRCSWASHLHRLSPCLYIYIITDEVSFGRRDEQSHLCSQMKQSWYRALLKGTNKPGFKHATQWLLHSEAIASPTHSQTRSAIPAYTFTMPVPHYHGHRWSRDITVWVWFQPFT